MRRATLGAFVAVAALGALVACNGGQTHDVVPSAAADGAMSPAAPLTAGLAPAVKGIVLSKKSLDFTATGADAAKTFVATERGYKGLFRLTSTCGKDVHLAPASAKGPSATFKATPERDTECAATIKDTQKHEVKLPITVKSKVKPSPSPTPTSTPSTSPSGSPGNLQNGNFASGSLSPGWTACSFVHDPYTAPVNPSPTPESTPTQNPSPTAAIASSALAALAKVTSPPAQLNPNVTATMPPLGSYVALAGDPESETIGAAGICQTFTVDASYKYLSFWAWEGGTEYDFAHVDQEADILDSTGSAIESTLFAEENCFWDPGVVGDTGYTDDGCIPASDGGTSSYQDWLNGGYWVKRGPYDLTQYAGKKITLFIGVWDQYSDPGPTTYGNEIFVGNVQMSDTDAFPSSRHRPQAPVKLRQ